MRYFSAITLFAIWAATLAGAPINLPDGIGQITISSEGKELTGEITGSEWKCADIKSQMKITNRAGILEVRMIFTTPGATPKKLSLKVSGKFSGTQPFIYFNGSAEKTLNERVKRLKREETFDTFPLVSLYDANSGLAIGLTPDTVVGVLASATELDSTNNGVLSLSTQVVLDNIKEQEVAFVLMRYSAEFGYANAVETYYNVYPEYFVPGKGVNPKIYGVGGYYQSAYCQHPLELHGGRMSQLDWEWSYAPWIEAGNWHTSKDQWVDGVSEVSQFFKINGVKKGTFEEFNASVKKRFEVGTRTSAMYFYILVKDMMMTLGDKYPEARFADENGADKTPSGLYSISANKYKTYLTFAPGSDLQPYIEEQLRLCVQDYRIDGFAFDMANFGINNYGRSQFKYAVGRCFDDKGRIYTPDAILPVYFADYIHTLKRGDEKMTVYMNMARESLSPWGVFHADGVMFEGEPDSEIVNSHTLRLMAGRKPMTFWGGLGNGESNPSILWNQATRPDDKKALYNGLKELLLLKCLEYGASPMNWAIVSDLNFFTPFIKPIIAMKKAGFNPVSAIKSSAGKSLWYGRFGYNENTILTITNPQREAVTADFEILTKYFGPGSYIVVPHQGQILNEKFDGKSIKFNLTMQPKGKMILTVIKLADNTSGEVNVSAATYRNINLGFTELSKKADLIIPSEALDGGILNPADFSADKGSKLKIEYIDPVWVSSTDKAIVGFFTTSMQKNSAASPVIVLPQSPSRDLETAAIMLDRYYPYCEGSMAYAHRRWTVESGFIDAKFATCNPMTITNAPLVNRKAIYIGKASDFPQFAPQLSTAKLARSWIVKIDDNILFVGGKTDADALEAMNKYFSILDK